MKLFEKIKKINFYFMIVFIFLFGTKIILFSIQWSEDGERLLPKVFNINGNKILSSKEILDLIKISNNNSLLDIDLKLIQYEIEKHPYIKVAQLSRKFPNQLNVKVSSVFQ